jgi:hypothetical protein
MQALLVLWNFRKIGKPKSVKDQVLRQSFIDIEVAHSNMSAPIDSAV